MKYSGRGPFTRLGIVLVIICCLAGNGCSHSAKPEKEKTASVISSDSVTVAEDYSNDAMEIIATQKSVDKAEEAQTAEHIHTWIYSSYDTAVSQQNVQVCWDCGTHYVASKCPNCGSSAYYATTDVQYATVEERECSSCGAYEYLGEK